MKEGDIILTPMPQADGKVKNRPAIYLREMPSFRDALVCGVSTQTRQLAPDFDELITRQFRVRTSLRGGIHRLGASSLDRFWNELAGHRSKIHIKSDSSLVLSLGRPLTFPTSTG